LATDTARQLFACDAPCLGDDAPVYARDEVRVAFIRASCVESDAVRSEVPSDRGVWIGELGSGDVTQITRSTDPPCDR
jgi:hypothetical protein